MGENTPSLNRWEWQTCRDSIARDLVFLGTSANSPSYNLGRSGPSICAPASIFLDAAVRRQRPILDGRLPNFLGISLMKWFKLAFGMSLCVIVTQMGCQPKSAYQAPPAPHVSVAKAIVKTVPIFLEENGQTEAAEQAVVQARVRGILQEIRFEPDSLVTENTPLFLIEQQEYQAALQSAAASVSSAKAALESARAAQGVADAQIAASDAAIKVSQAEFNRMQSLLESRSISQSEYDAAQAQLETSIAARQGAVAAKVANEADITNAQAQVAKAEAELADAQLNLDRTVINAPISGRIAKTLVKRGNLVESGTPLVEIVKERSDLGKLQCQRTVSARF